VDSSESIDRFEPRLPIRGNVILLLINPRSLWDDTIERKESKEKDSELSAQKRTESLVGRM